MSNEIIATLVGPVPEAWELQPWVVYPNRTVFVNDQLNQITLELFTSGRWDKVLNLFIPEKLGQKFVKTRQEAITYALTLGKPVVIKTTNRLVLINDEYEAIVALLDQ
jgi:hypothetical protein